MSKPTTEPMELGVAERNPRKRELLVFFFLTCVLMPGLAIAVVGGYGFCVWMYQLIAGPPTS